jgi:uncharacterized delta-60 repeat protein
MAGRTEAIIGWAMRALALAVLAAWVAAAPALAASSSVGGLVDSSFGSGGSVTVPVGSLAGAAAVVVQRDGRIVTAGQATVNGQEVIVATRMTSSGRMDSTFGQKGIVTVAINGGAGMDSGAGLALQPDGKIVIAGDGRDGTYGPLEFAAVRLNTNGSLDQTFGHGGIASVDIGPYSIANAVLIQPDGKIVLAGTAQEDHIVFAAARLNPNGTPDTSFGQNGTVTLPDQTAGAWAATLQSDGKIVLAGQANYDNPSVTGAQQFMAARLNSDGSLDQSFAQNGIDLIPVGQTALGFGIAREANNKLLLAGIAFTFTNVNATVQLNPDGTPDTTYGTGGTATVLTTAGTNGLILDSAGNAIMPLVGPGAERITPNGTPDTSFGTSGISLVKGLSGGANGVALQSDGKVVLAGAVTVNGQIELNVVRLTAPVSTSTTSTAQKTTSSTTTAKPKPKIVQTLHTFHPAIVRANDTTVACATPPRAQPKHPRRGRHHHRRHKHRRTAIRTVHGCWQ